MREISSLCHADTVVEARGNVTTAGEAEATGHTEKAVQGMRHLRVFPLMVVEKQKRKLLPTRLLLSFCGSCVPLKDMSVFGETWV